MKRRWKEEQLNSIPIITMLKIDKYTFFFHHSTTRRKEDFFDLVQIDQKKERGFWPSYYQRYETLIHPFSHFSHFFHPFLSLSLFLSFPWKRWWWCPVMDWYNIISFPSLTKDDTVSTRKWWTDQEGKQSSLHKKRISVSSSLLSFTFSSAEKHQILIIKCIL